MATTARYAWQPQIGPQADAISATWCTELLYGGARGGGKSDFLLGDFLQGVARYGSNWHGILFRRTYPELQEIIRRSLEIYAPTGAIYRVGDKEWLWPNGAVLRLRFLEREQDASRYQGHSFSWIGWDELTQWPTDDAYKLIRACLRWASGDVPEKRIRASANPGGPGHGWVKKLFIDPAPHGFKPIEDKKMGTTRMFIPARVIDNKILLQTDPNYIDRLKGVGSQELVKAWLDGDWTIVVGSYFPEFDSRHVVRPHSIPPHWTRFRSFDWGSMRPFSVGWWAVSDGTGDYPANALIRYREWYGASGPNVGLKMTVEQVAQEIKARSGNEEYKYSVADPAIFKTDGGPSMAERMKQCGVLFRPADNRRVPGWDQIRQRLLGEEKPMLYVFNTCIDFIRTFPTLQHDAHNIEDVDTNGEDHVADEARYAVMSRPYQKPFIPSGPKRGVNEMTLNEAFSMERISKQREKMARQIYDY